jgi:GntR family transcriptional regulator
MNITLVSHSAVPFYEQIKEQIKAGIKSGELNAGDKLPSLRRLARELRVSLVTTVRAYKDLEDEGFIKSIQGRGCFVYPLSKDKVITHRQIDIGRNECETEIIAQMSLTAEIPSEVNESKLTDKYIVLNKIAFLRKAQCLKQGDLAKALKVSRQMIVSYETNTAIPSLPMAFKIAHFFGYEINEVFFSCRIAKDSTSTPSERGG